jgi:hypothetical protein
MKSNRGVILLQVELSDKSSLSDNSRSQPNFYRHLQFMQGLSKLLTFKFTSYFFFLPLDLYFLLHFHQPCTYHAPRHSTTKKLNDQCNPALHALSAKCSCRESSHLNRPTPPPPPKKHFCFSQMSRGKGTRRKSALFEQREEQKKRATELQQSYYGYAVESAAGSPRNKLSVHGIPVLKKVRRKFAKKVQQ